MDFIIAGFYMETITYRKAGPADVGLILHFIHLMAEYEKLSSEVTAIEALLNEWIFQKGAAEVMFAMHEGQEVGFVLYFYNFSTFTGRAGLYVEDVFVLPQWRGRGIGRGIFRKLADMAVEQGCGRMEWVCLDWNKPSNEFYKSLGARPMDEWTVYRLTRQQLPRLAQPD